MLRRARHRLQIAVLVISCLIFQQAALAAYNCSRDSQPPPTVASSHCAEMGMAPAAQQVPALCEKHCTPDLTLPADTTVHGVPALCLPAPFLPALDEPSAHLAQHSKMAILRSDPPPRLRFCSLQI